MNWIKGHKFWTSVILLVVVGFMIVQIAGSGPRGGFAVGQLVAIYVCIGWPIKLICSKINKSIEKRRAR